MSDYNGGGNNNWKNNNGGGNNWKNNGGNGGGNGGGFKRPTPKKTVMSTRGWTLKGEKLPGGDSVPTIAFDIGANNPRLRVYANKDDKYIQANLGPEGFYAILGALKTIRNNPEPMKLCMSVKHMYDAKGQKHDSPIELCKIWIGRDKARVLFITVSSADFEPIKFPFLPTFFNTLEDGEGNPIDKATLSEMTFDGFMALGVSTYAAAFAVGFSDNNNAPKSGGGFQNSGGNSNWKNRNGGGNSNWKGGNNNWKNRNNGNGGGNGNWQNRNGGGNYQNDRSQGNDQQAAPPPEQNDNGNDKWDF